MYFRVTLIDKEDTAIYDEYIESCGHEEGAILRAIINGRDGLLKETIRNKETMIAVVKYKRNTYFYNVELKPEINITPTRPVYLCNNCDKWVDEYDYVEEDNLCGKCFDFIWEN